MRAIGEFHDAKTVKKLVEPAARHAAGAVERRGQSTGMRSSRQVMRS